jgi:hypothetical protein
VRLVEAALESRRSQEGPLARRACRPRCKIYLQLDPSERGLARSSFRTPSLTRILPAWTILKCWPQIWVESYGCAGACTAGHVRSALPAPLVAPYGLPGDTRYHSLRKLQPWEMERAFGSPIGGAGLGLPATERVGEIRSYGRLELGFGSQPC